METRFECFFEGKKIFQVVQEATPLFTGTWAQCERFKDVYNAKVMKSRFRSRKSSRVRSTV